MAKNIIRGEEHFRSVEGNLKDAVDEFTSALTHFTHGVILDVGLQTLKVVKDTHKDVQGTTRGPVYSHISNLC